MTLTYLTYHHLITQPSQLGSSATDLEKNGIQKPLLPAPRIKTPSQSLQPTTHENVGIQQEQPQRGFQTTFLL
jgi:hypothetical protein